MEVFGFRLQNPCRFCNIAAHRSTNPQDAILFEDEEIIAFHDRKGAAAHHLLVVPKTHINDCRCLTREHLPLLNRLVETGISVMESRLRTSVNNNGCGITSNPGLDDIKMGFHYPPFISVPHLHLHVIAPYSQLKRDKRRKFSPEDYQFVSPEFVKYQIEKRGGRIPTASGQNATIYRKLEMRLQEKLEKRFQNRRRY